jgi:hypothetical protein
MKQYIKPTAYSILFVLIAVLVYTGCSMYQKTEDSNSSQTKIDEIMSYFSEANVNQLENAYISAEKAALQQIEVIADFHKLYPEAGGVFTHFASDAPERVKWTSRTFVYDRYIFQMTLYITLDRDYETVRSHSNPEWFLMEVTKVEERGGGSISTHNGSSYELTMDQWLDVLEHGGDLEVVIPSIRKNSPVPGFDIVKESTAWKLRSKSPTK